MKNFTLFLFTCLLISNKSSAQPGTLDSTFGNNGIAVKNVYRSNYGAESVVIQSDGKIVVAGITHSHQRLTLIRYNSDGHPDNRFGYNGIADLEEGLIAPGDPSLALESDGKILAALSTFNNDNPTFTLVRFKSNGFVDSTFGKNGLANTDIGFAYSLAVETDGKIVVAGRTYDYPNRNIALVRYTHNGDPDSSFGLNGKVITDFSGKVDEGYSVVIEQDGRIVVGGESTVKKYDCFALARYKHNGDLDSSFGTNGKVITDLGTYAFVYSVAMQSDGKIIAAGNVDDGYPNFDLALVRYHHNGTIDSAFGVNGIVTNDFGNNDDEAQSMAIQADGKIIVAGITADPDKGYDFALARFKRNGQLDRGFGTEGKVITDLGNNSYDYARSLALQADGKIVVAGGIYETVYEKFAVVRYNGDNTAVANKSTSNFSNLQKQNNTSANIHLSPNPGNDILHITGLSSSTKTISIVDANGKLLQQITTANANYSFSVKQLAAGMYFLRIDEGDKSIALKFIKE